ncbi:MAG: hypothetical protein WBV77_16845, partial [Solirubrobacteraceae bacterium]
TTTDPFAVPHDLIADQLEPFCDGDLQRFTRSELLRAYDLATAWADELETARTAALNIAAEWQERHGERIPRISNEVQSSLAAALAGPFGNWLADHLSAGVPLMRVLARRETALSPYPIS